MGLFYVNPYPNPADLTTQVDCCSRETFEKTALSTYEDDHKHKNSTVEADFYTVNLARAKLPAKAAGKLIRRQTSPQVLIACGFCA